MPSDADLLDASQDLYLRRLFEPHDNALTVVIEEAVVNNASVETMQVPKHPELDHIFRDAKPIESLPGCRTFQLSWNRYIAYLVTEEFTGACGGYDDEVFTGKTLRLYRKSHFLDHLEKDTGGHPEPLLHYKLICLNHLIDVASYAPPEIRIIATR